MSDLGKPHTEFRAGAVRTARYWLDYIRAHAGDLAALDRVWDNALQAIQSCYEFAEAHSLVVELTLALHDHMDRQGAWDLWVDYLMLAVKAGEQLGDLKATGQLLDKLGVMQRQLGRWDDAQTHFERAQEIQAGVGDEAGLATTLNNMGISLASFEQALVWCRESGDPTEALAGDEARPAATEYAQALKLCESSTNDRLRQLHSETQARINDVLARLVEGGRLNMLQTFREELGAGGVR